MATAKFGRIGRYHSDSLFKVESLESAGFGDITVGYGRVANGRVYILGQQADIGNNLCFVNNPGTRELSITLGSSIYINGSEINQTSASAVFSTIYDDVTVISRVAYIFENGDYNFFAGNYPTNQRPVIVDGQPAILDVSECYLHLLKNGNYVMLNQQVANNTEVYLIDSTPGNPPTITEVSVFVGTYGAYTYYDFEVIEGEYSIRIVPELLEFQKNSGIHEIPWDTYEPEFILNGEAARISAGTTAPFFPENSGLTSIGFPDLKLVLDTDNNTANEFTLRFNVGNGFGTADSIIRVVGGEPNPNPYNPGGVSRPGGGGGSFNVPESDNVSVDVPLGTDIGDDSSTGMYTRYLMNTQYMKLFGDWMWDPNLGLSLIKTIFESWYGEKQSESLISLLSFPFSLTAPLTGIVSQTQPLFLGHQNILANYIALKSGGAQIDWGTLNLEEYWGNFLDYSPHTKIELYLPWGTGFVDIDPGQCLPGSLRVVTNIEFARGSCTHNVINQDGCVLGTYMGQPGSMIPMLASDIASKRAGMLVGAVSAAVGGAVVGGASAVSAIGQRAAVSAYTTSMSRLPMTMPASSRSAIATGIASQPLNVANEISSNLMPGASLAGHIASDAAIASRRHPAHMTRNGGFGDASAGTMIQYPYVIISRPEQNVPDSYGHHYGYPSNIYEPLANLRGYTEIAAIHLNGIGCTASEMSELESILAGGVIF